MTSTDRKQVPLGLLSFPLSLAFVVDGLASSAGVQTIGASSVSVASYIINSSPVSSSMSELRRISQKVTPMMSKWYLIWKVISLLISCWVTDQVSAPYRSTDMTMA